MHRAVLNDETVVAVKVQRPCIDAVIALDTRCRVVDLNPAARRIFGAERSAIIGQPVTRLFPDQGDLIERYDNLREARTEIVLGEGAAQREYDLRISPLMRTRSRMVKLMVSRTYPGFSTDVDATTTGIVGIRP